MPDREIKNAQIIATMLGVEDHGIFTVMLSLDYGGSGQGFGGWALDGKGEPRGGERVGTAWGMEFIARVMRTVGVKKWEDLKGKFIRVDATDGRVYRIGHITKDLWFDPKVDLQAFLVQA